MQKPDDRLEVPSILSKVNLLRGDKVLWVIIPILFVEKTVLTPEAARVYGSTLP